jgi:amino acid adenylation domain-containing protein
VIATLAILKAGAAYVPLDPAYPPARLAHMLSDAALQTVLCSTAAGPLLQQLQPGLQLVPVDGLAQSAAAYAGYADTNPQVPGLHSGHLAYAIYTSGSTGTPKGVLLQHQGLLNLQMNSEQLLGVNQHSRVLHFASMSFDAGSWELMMALLGGGTLVIADSQTRLSPEAVSELLYRERISHALLPPALLAMMPYRDDLALQALIVGGEACEQDLAARWNSRYRFFNAYGPTEASVVATLTQVLPGQQVTIGRPLHNVSALILDSRQALLPVGVAGELYLSGVGLARGYLGQPGMSAERFIANPYAQAGQPALSERLYRTGDLVRYQADGQIEYLGRLDEQVKIRGFRVELAEIRHQLNLLPGVVSSYVALLRDQAALPQLVAYVQISADTVLPDVATFSARLKTQLSAVLPAHMLPVAFVPVDSWPLTPNGKVDKTALPQPVLTGSAAYVAAANATEQQLLDIIAGLLALDADKISITANFFDLGGHSLLLMRLLSAIQQQFGTSLEVRALFECQTIRDVAQLIVTEQQLLQLVSQDSATPELWEV